MEIRSSPNYIWNLKDVLGQGATGTVYKGRDKKTGIEVAIKVTNQLAMMRPTEVRKREFEVLNRLKHGNIVRIFASENELRSQNEIMAMELCTGGSLSVLLEHPSNSYGFSEYDCKAIITDVVAGMEHLRKQEIVHRDLKPGNIMRVFNEDGTCNYKLTDFGAAKELENSAEQFLSIYGTEEYLHPDLYERGVLKKSTGKTFGANVDLWSIGVTIYHIATGKLPFRPHGGRQNRDTMYHITTAKASGMISGVQRSFGGNIEWSDKLPDHTNLSRGFQDLLVPILAGVLESDPAKMMSFDEFFSQVQDMVTRKVISVYHVQTSSFHEIYIPSDESFEKFQDKIFKETGLQSDHQRLFFNGEEFGKSRASTAENLPITSRDNPLILIGGEFALPGDLKIRKIPSVTELTEGWTLEADAAAAKIRCNCAYACKVSTLQYTQVVKAMSIALDAAVKSSKNDLIHAAADCSEVTGRRETASHMTRAVCQSVDRIIILLQDLMPLFQLSDEDKISIEKDFKAIRQSMQNKVQSNSELDKVKDFIEKIKVLRQDVVNNDSYAGSLREFNAKTDEKLLYPLISNLTGKIHEIYERYRDNKQHRRLSFADEQTHIYDRKRLAQLTDRLVSKTKEMFQHRIIIYRAFMDIFKEVYLYQREALRLKDQLLRIAPADQAHVAALEAFQNGCHETFHNITTKLCQAGRSKQTLQETTHESQQLPSPTNGVSDDVLTEHLIREMETHMRSLVNVTEYNQKAAKENSGHLRDLTNSFTEFYGMLTESGARTLNDLRVLQQVPSPPSSTTIAKE